MTMSDSVSVTREGHEVDRASDSGQVPDQTDGTVTVRARGYGVRSKVRSQ